MSRRFRLWWRGVIIGVCVRTAYRGKRVTYLANAFLQRQQENWMVADTARINKMRAARGGEQE